MGLFDQRIKQIHTSFILWTNYLNWIESGAVHKTDKNQCQEYLKNP